MFPRKNGSSVRADFKELGESNGSQRDVQDPPIEIDLIGQKEDRNRERIWSPLFVTIMGIGMLASIFSYSLYNILPSLTAEITDSPGAGGLLSAVFAAMAGLGRLVSGYITDKWGRYNTLLAADLIFLFAGILPILWPGYAVLLVMRVWQGLAFALILTAINAAVADIVPPARLGEGFGYYGMGFAVSIAVGPAVGLALLRFQNHQITFLGTEAIVVLALFLSLFCKYEKNRVPFLFFLRRSKKGIRTVGKEFENEAGNIENANVDDVKGRKKFFHGFLESGAFLTMTLGFIYFTGVSFFSSYVTYFAKERGVSYPDVFFLCGALTILLSRFTLGRLVDRYSPIKIFLPAIGVFYLSLGMLCILQYTWELALAGFFFGIGVGIVFPLLNTLSIKRSSPKRRGAATATFALGTDSGFALGTLLWGFVGDCWGYQISIEGVLIVLTGLIILSLFKFRELNKVY